MNAACCILALDEGTTSARAILFDREGNIRSLAQNGIRQIYPRPGWVEHDPEELWRAQARAAEDAVAKAGLSASDIAAVGITNQRETVVLWDRETGEAIHNAIVWQDRRTATMCDRLAANGCEPLIRERTGLVIDPYFSGTKLTWLLDNVPGARARAEAGRLAFGTVDSWLIWKLTGGRTHCTDATNASRTMFFNIHTGQWDDELLRLFRIPVSILPEVRSSSEVYGPVTAPGGLAGIPIAGIAGDQQAGLFGQMCITPGMTKCTYGTGCFMLQHCAGVPVASRHRLVTTVAWRMAGRTEYALEGSVFIGGAVVQWLRDGLRLIRTSDEIEALAASVPDSAGVSFVPAFAGLGAPHWDSYARGTIIGLTQDSTAGHIARAALESIAFQVADLQEAMRRDTGISIQELRVDGGAVKDNLLMQIQADLLGAPVVRPAVTEATALGAAYLAGLAVGFWRSPEEVASQWRIERRFEPQLPREKVQSLREIWSRAVERASGWARP